MYPESKKKELEKHIKQKEKATREQLEFQRISELSKLIDEFQKKHNLYL